MDSIMLLYPLGTITIGTRVIRCHININSIYKYLHVYSIWYITIIVVIYKEDKMTRTGVTVKIASHRGHAFGYAPSIFRWDIYQEAQAKCRKLEKKRIFKRRTNLYNALIKAFNGGGL